MGAFSKAGGTKLSQKKPQRERRQNRVLRAWWYAWWHAWSYTWCRQWSYSGGGTEDWRQILPAFLQRWWHSDIGRGQLGWKLLMIFCFFFGQPRCKTRSVFAQSHWTQSDISHRFPSPPTWMRWTDAWNAPEAQWWVTHCKTTRMNELMHVYGILWNWISSRKL